MENEDEKKHRKRTKKLLNSIQKQLDFYFSDANLRHDGFLRKEITESSDGFIPLTTLLTFNKVKELCTEVAMLAKAAENSEMLQLNEERDKVKRVLPIPNKQNTDAQTVYVEQLHAYHDHDYLREVFSSCGTVEYISLPRYKHNNQIKGFAFIEFSNHLEAEKACRFLHTAVVPKLKTKKRHSTDKVTDAVSCDETLQSKRKRRRSVSFSESSDLDSRKKQNVLKRRRSVSECSDESTMKLKKKRKSSSDDKGIPTTLSEIKARALKESLELNGKQNDNVKATVKNGKKRKRSDSSKEGETSDVKIPKNDSESENESEGEKCVFKEKPQNFNKKSESSDNDGHNKTKKKRNRKHTKKNEEVKDIVVPPLYVIPKFEWLSMKKQYKDLQRKEIKELKQQMRVLKTEKVRRKELKERVVESIERKETKWKAEENQPEKPSENNSDKIKTQEKASDAKKFEEKSMTPGTVVFLKTPNENLKRQDIKSTLSQHTTVAYVDYIDGCPSGHVRLRDAEMLEKLFDLDKSVKKEWTFRIKRMTEEEEKEYLEKAAEDRRKKYEKNNQKKERRNIRGKDKVMLKADKIMN